MINSYRLRYQGLGLLVLTAFVSLQAHAITLGQVVRRTLTTNPEVLAARARMESARSDIMQAQGQFYPQVFARAAEGRERSVNPAVLAEMVDARTLRRSESSIQASQLLFSGFGVVNQVRQRKFDYTAANCQYSDVIQTIILRTSETYLNVLRDRALVALSRANVRVHEETLRKVTLRYKGGAGRRDEVSLAKSRLAKARAQLVAAEGQLDQDVSRYYSVTGFPPEHNMVMPVRSDAFLPRTEYQAIRSADAYHPAITAATANADAAVAGVGVARSHFYPRLDAEFIAADNENLDGIEGPNREIKGMAVVSYDLFKGFSDYAAVNSAQAEKRRAERFAEQVRRQVHERVRIAAAQMKSARGQVKRYAMNVAQEKEVVADYKKQFELGKRQLFNVLDAENDLFVAKNNLLNAQYDHAISYYRVLEAIGKLTPKVLSGYVKTAQNGKK